MSGTKGASCNGMKGRERCHVDSCFGRAAGNLVDDGGAVKQEAAAGSIYKLARGGVDLDETAGGAVGMDDWRREHEMRGQKQEQRCRRFQTHFW